MATIPKSDQDPNRPEDFYEPRPFNVKVWWISIGLLCAIITFSSLFVVSSYRKRSEMAAKDYRPGKLYKLETDLIATNRDGSEISFSKEFYGKRAFITGYQYTDCPSGCLGMAAMMKELHAEFSEKYPHFGLVSISVNPADDTPEKMDTWVKDKGVDVPNWWFLTGDPEKIKSYMRDEFRLHETEEITDPELIPSVGPYSHDQRLVLVDEFANVRGLYNVMSTQDIKDYPEVEGVSTFGELEFERLKKELELVLSEFDPEKAKAAQEAK